MNSLAGQRDFAAEHTASKPVGQGPAARVVQVRNLLADARELAGSSSAFTATALAIRAGGSLQMRGVR